MTVPAPVVHVGLEYLFFRQKNGDRHPAGVFTEYRCFSNRQVPLIEEQFIPPGSASRGA